MTYYGGNELAASFRTVQLMMLERMLGLVPHLTRQFQARMAQAQQARQAQQ